MDADSANPSPPPDSVSRELGDWMAELGDIDPAIEATRLRVAKLARLLERNLVRIAAHHDLAMGDWEALSYLQRSGAPYEAAPKALARELGVTSGTMSVRIERLIQAGLVESGTPLADRRSRPIRLTEEGRRRWRCATSERTTTEQRLLGEALTATEYATLNALLGRLLAHLEEEFGPAPRHGTLRDDAG